MVGIRGGHGAEFRATSSLHLIFYEDGIVVRRTIITAVFMINVCSKYTIDEASQINLSAVVFFVALLTPPLPGRPVVTRVHPVFPWFMPLDVYRRR